MGFFERFGGKSFDTYVAEAVKQGIPIIDVRDASEFAQGHIPDAINIPLSSLDAIAQAVPDKAAKIYVHCLSGARSSRAASQLKAMGYEDVTNIGGISAYKGKMSGGGGMSR